MSIPCYIAGPMEGSKRADLNFPLFDHVAAKARAAGYDAFSPADFSRDLHGSPELFMAMSREERQEMRKRLLARELKWICEQAEVVYMLPGWQNSLGAQAERMTALAVGVDVEDVPAKWLEDYVDPYDE